MQQFATNMQMEWERNEKASTVSLDIFAYVSEDNSNKLIKYQESTDV